MSERRTKPLFDFSIGPTKARAEKKPRTQMCEMPGCDKPGTHQAPKSRENTRERRWLCLEHVRAINENWNFFDGMSDEQVREFQKDAQTGHRPTWNLKSRQSTSWKVRGDKGTFTGHTEDTYQVFEDGRVSSTRSDVAAKRVRVVGKLQMESLTALNLTPEASLNEVKQRYKELVKRYHPDVNGGDRSAEERLAQVIRAYNVLKKSNFG